MLAVGDLVSETSSHAGRASVALCTCVVYAKCANTGTMNKRGRRSANVRSEREGDFGTDGGLWQELERSPGWAKAAEGEVVVPRAMTGVFPKGWAHCG